ncbi:MAG TPA: hypothetical protein VGK67_17230 [Myxococcales bacterium]
MLALLALGAASFALPGVARLPQFITASALALGLISVMPIQTRAWGVAQAYGWLAARPIIRRGIGSHRPFQFAAAILALLVVSLERLPGWLSLAVPRVLAQFSADLGHEGLPKTLVVWTVAGLIGLGIFLIVVGFAVVVVVSAFSSSAIDRRGAASLAVLWNVLATGVLVAAQVPDIFSGHGSGPGDWFWWVSLVFALEIARRVLLLSLLFAYEKLEIALEGPLAEKVLDVRIRPAATAAGLAVLCLAFLAIERPLGVVGALSAVVVASELMALALERLAPRAPVMASDGASR